MKLFLYQLPHINPATRKYKVWKMVNTVDYHIGETLKVGTVHTICQNPHNTITITKEKK